MRTTKIALLAAALALAGTATAGNKSGEKFRADLSGDNEVPPVATDASGDFRLAYDDFEGTATYRIRLNDASRVFQAHIHCGAAGVNGPVAVWLAGRPAAGAWDVDGKWIDNATVTDEDVIPSALCGSSLADLIEAIRAGNVYVNVHTRNIPGGEVRGQVEED